jgi:outer membrane lipoprotein-sorting protein
MPADVAARLKEITVDPKTVTLKKNVTVAGSEDVTVPAGQFTTWKVELASAEGEPGATTVWVDKATRKVVKTTATLPQMGGATLTSELAAGS